MKKEEVLLRTVAVAPAANGPSAPAGSRQASSFPCAASQKTLMF